MDETDWSQSASIDQIMEEVQMLIHVLRMLSGKASDPDVADELVDLADTLDHKVEGLRAAIAALLA